MSNDAEPPQSIEEMDPTDVVWVAPATQGTASRRSAHLSEECEYCLDNANKYEVRTMPNIDGLCAYCTGDPRSVGDDESRDVDWSAQKVLWGAAERADSGTDPIEALEAEHRARAESSSEAEMEDAE